MQSSSTNCKVLEENDTSIIFKPILKKLTATFYEARRSIKKRTKDNTSNDANVNAVVDLEDEESIFNILENM